MTRVDVSAIISITDRVGIVSQQHIEHSLTHNKSNNLIIIIVLIIEFMDY